MRSVTYALYSPAINRTVQLSGLTDFISGNIDPSNQCCCGSVARVRIGLCAKCLLQSSLHGALLDETSFELELAEINVPDRDWRLGNYQIIEEIARGGMGVVYRARHLPSRRIVALKRVLTYHSDSQETLARFQTEAQAAASLEHPNILPIYDVGTTEDGLPFFSMKLAAGGSLQSVKDQFIGDPLRPAQIIAKVARAIEFAHKHGVIHRDLKPGNILLDACAEPMVADFGLAKWLDRSADLTCTLTVFGTPGYIAPEQAGGIARKQNRLVDIYSLGAIFFELLSGRPPFLGEHALDVIRQATEKPAPKLRSLVSTIPRDLETICARCLDRDPARRYESAGELAEDIDRWIEDRPIVARPLSPPIKLWCWARRNRPLAISISTCLVLMSAAIGWQIDNFRLGTRFREEQIAGHSVAVMPFLNLDDGAPDLELTRRVADSLRRQMLAIGPAKIVGVAAVSPLWTGTGTAAELKATLGQTGCRVALVGMYRQTVAGRRISIRFVDPTSAGAFRNWTTDVNTLEDVPRFFETAKLGSSVYHVLDNAKIVPSGEPDPTLVDPTAREDYNAGRSLLERRTIQDVDRAIHCFESAIKAAPQTVLARSYLALALMGRNFLAADPGYVERAYTAANEALKISPGDSNSHRALGALEVSRGQLDEAIEHGFRALELGDPTERALGQIAYLWKDLGRPDKAIQWFAKAKIGQDQPPDYDAILGDAWALLGDDKRAADAYLRAANFRPDLPDGWLGSCHVKMLQGRFDEARTLFQQRAAEYYGFHNTKQLAAQLELFGRNFVEAETLYAAILRDDPNGVAAAQYGTISSKSAVARLKIAKGDEKAGRELLRQCLAYDQAELARSPKHPEVLYRLAADEAIAGNSSAALSYLRSSIAAGYIDYRSMRMDPRFDAVARSAEFRQITASLATHVAELRHRAEMITTNLNNN